MKIGETIELSKKTFEVIGCKHCKEAMVNIDSDEIGLGDLVKLKFSGVKVSNPETDEAVCIHCDIAKKPSKRKALADWMNSPSNNDSSWHSSSSPSPSTSSFDFGSGGGFGGGSFGGGGASGSW